MQRTRIHGTKEFKPETPQERIAAIREVVTNKQYAKIDNTMIDLFSASIIIQVYDALKPENQAKFSAMPAGKMGVIALKLAN